ASAANANPTNMIPINSSPEYIEYVATAANKSEATVIMLGLILAVIGFIEIISYKMLNSFFK
ncbi:MAG: hypothetical protein ACPL0A_02725, partial [Candidatus Micrarchaeia archaeon]